MNHFEAISENISKFQYDNKGFTKHQTFKFYEHYNINDFLNIILFGSPTYSKEKEIIQFISSLTGNFPKKVKYILSKNHFIVSFTETEDSISFLRALKYVPFKGVYLNWGFNTYKGRNLKFKVLNSKNYISKEVSNEIKDTHISINVEKNKKKPLNIQKVYISE